MNNYDMQQPVEGYSLISSDYASYNRPDHTGSI